MPELPDIIAYVEALERRVTAQVVDAVRLRGPFVVRSVDPPISATAGQTVVGVRRMGRDNVTRVLPPVGTVHSRYVCVVGFRGPYQSGEVDAPGPSPSGRYALVVVTHRGTTLLKTVLVDRLPLRLGHL